MQSRERRSKVMYTLESLMSSSTQWNIDYEFVREIAEGYLKGFPKDPSEPMNHGDFLKWLWSKHKVPFSGRAVKLSHMPRIPTTIAPMELVNEAVAYDSYIFERDEYRAPTHTVTRITCQGITVEETIQYFEEDKRR